MRDRFFENFRKSKYRSKFLILFLGITHQRVSLEKLWLEMDILPSSKAISQNTMDKYN